MSDGVLPQAGAQLRAARAVWVPPASQQDDANAVALGHQRGDERPDKLRTFWRYGCMPVAA
jgi:hypothetical protein